SDGGTQALVQPRTRVVPVEQRDEQHERHQQHGDRHHDPDQDAACAGHLQRSIRIASKPSDSSLNCRSGARTTVQDGACDRAHLRAARACRKVANPRPRSWERRVVMLWQKGRSSDNVEEASGSGGGGLGIGRIHLGLGGTIIAIIIAMIFPSTRGIIFGLLTGSGGMTGAGNTPAQTAPVDKSDPQVQFVSKILGSTEDVWTADFQQMGKQYIDPKLVLFHGQVATACGGASAAVGPFYCPGDKRVYLDLDFFQELATRFHS